jgi:molecular chaperone GrpE
MDPSLKETLLEQFRAYLEGVDAGPDAVQDAGGRENEVDLFGLFSELAALKNEVKLEARQFKGALDQFREIFSVLQSGYGNLQAELERCRSAQQAQERQALRPLLLQFLDLRDRIEAGVQTLSAYRPGGWGRFCRQGLRFLAGVREGQEITLRRLDQVLAGHRVYPLETVGRPLDPHTMRAAEVDSRADVDHGIVTGELRKGFLWEGEVLRLAEVRVNKR